MDKAGGYFQKAYDLSGNVSRNERFAIRFHYDALTLGDLEAGAKNIEEWTETYPADEWGRMELVDIETQIGNFARAIEAGEYELKYGPTSPEDNYQALARAYLRSNRFADAKRTIAAAQATGKDGSSRFGKMRMRMFRS